MLVIIPTYNERENLRDPRAGCTRPCPTAHVLVVDDASPDGTGELADELAAADERVHVLHRPAKAGLGAAYVAGFDWGWTRGYDVLVEMDADGSHAPEQLPRLLGRARRTPTWCSARAGCPAAQVRELAEVAASCSPAAATSTPGWRWASPLRDATGGYRAYRREVLERHRPRRRSPRRATASRSTWPGGRCRRGYRVVEVPITFAERERGESQDERRDRARGAVCGSPSGALRTAAGRHAAARPAPNG